FSLSPAAIRVLHPSPTRRSSDLHLKIKLASKQGVCLPSCVSSCATVLRAAAITSPRRSQQPKRLNHCKRPFPSRPLISPKRTPADRKSTRLNSSHVSISYAVFGL